MCSAGSRSERWRRTALRSAGAAGSSSCKARIRRPQRCTPRCYRPRQESPPTLQGPTESARRSSTREAEAARQAREKGDAWGSRTAPVDAASTVQMRALCNGSAEPATGIAAHRADVARAHPAGLAKWQHRPVVAPRLAAGGSRGGADPAARVAANVPDVARVRPARHAAGVRRGAAILPRARFAGRDADPACGTATDVTGSAGGDPAGDGRESRGARRGDDGWRCNEVGRSGGRGSGYRARVLDCARLGRRCRWGDEHNVSR